MNPWWAHFQFWVACAQTIVTSQGFCILHFLCSWLVIFWIVFSIVFCLFRSVCRFFPSCQTNPAHLSIRNSRRKKSDKSCGRVFLPFPPLPSRRFPFEIRPSLQLSLKRAKICFLFPSKHLSFWNIGECNPDNFCIFFILTLMHGN